jgi:HEAT repeat protein
MIGQLGPTAKKAVPTLIREIRPHGNDLSPMTSAVIAIGQIVPDDPKHIKDAVQAILPLLNHDQLILRFQAATTLGHLGAPSRAAVERLKPMIKQNMSWELRRAAAYALGKVGRDDSGMPDMLALKALVDGIDDACKEVRVEALQGVINLGMPLLPQHQMELRGLLEQRARKDTDKFASIWVRVALLRMDAGPQADAYINDIAKHLKSTDLTLASDAARALGACGTIAKAKIPDLISTLKSSDITLTFWSAWALGRMGPDAKDALPTLTTLLESADSNVKTAAQEAIKQITVAKG